MEEDVLQPARSARSRAVENAINDALGGEEAVEPCPDCGALLEVKVIRPDVLVRCPNGHIDAHRRIVADPGWSMRLGFLIAAAIIIGLGMIRRFYFQHRPDPHRTTFIERVTPLPPSTP